MRAIVAASLLLVAAAGGTARAQDTAKDSVVGGFPIERFRANEAVARWMLAYDRCAWVTSDSLMATATEAERNRLGPEWFCFERDGWHAVYGRYDAARDTFDEVAHFRRDTVPGSRFRRVRERTPDEIALPYARALHATATRVPPSVLETGARFNSFVRRTPSGDVEVLAIPAWQTNGWLIHGVELRWVFDRDGRRVRDSTLHVTPLRGAPADTSRNLTIDDEARDVPSPALTFFLLAYHREFRSVRVFNRKFATTLMELNSESSWVHVVRDTVPRR